MNNLETNQNTGSMPISMAVAPKPSTEPAVAATGTVKDIDYFRSEFGKATLAFYRSTRKVADLLLEARITLSPEDFLELTKELQFDYSTVCKLIKSAANFRLNDPKNQPYLPESWTVRYEIMMMEEATFRIGVTKGIIHPNCTLADLKKLREQLEPPKRKKASPKAKAKPKDSTQTEKPEAPKPTTAKAETPEPQVEKAAVKGPINTSGLPVDAKASTGEAATATATAMAPAPAKGYIKIVLPKEVANQHERDLVRIVDEIQAVVKQYDFIGGVGLEVAA